MRQLAQRGKLSWQSSGSIVRVPSIATGTSMQHRRRRAQWGAARGRQSATVACAGFPANAEITKASHQSLTLTLVQRKVPQGIDSMNFLKRVTVTENPRVGGWIPPRPPRPMCLVKHLECDSLGLFGPAFPLRDQIVTLRHWPTRPSGAEQSVIMGECRSPESFAAI